MGTALQSTTDTQDRAAIEAMVKAVEKNLQKKRKLNRALSKAINHVIFEGQEIARVRNTVTAAIAAKVKSDVLPRFRAKSKSVKKKSAKTKKKVKR